ncbi:type II toxin-antitoxin system VapC family toxin [Halomonas jincaotanensis]|uniref:type II toxin-antitoxin system VapC family toxin n=1 Tax=Halomonas jincaotanensis TaxID=2810616 RepID=UPI002022DC1D|nr:type II toxin-antitoxin system VapC family toxin [Halomonas jincaotanensis]
MTICLHWTKCSYECIAGVFTGYQYPVRSCPQSPKRSCSTDHQGRRGTGCTSIIVAAELRYGAIKSNSAKLAERIDLILSALEILPLEPPADHQYASLRHHLRRQGSPIGPNDLLIASQALTNDLTVITANVREFSRVPGLKVENWLEA